MDIELEKEQGVTKGERMDGEQEKEQGATEGERMDGELGEEQGAIQGERNPDGCELEEEHTAGTVICVFCLYPIIKASASFPHIPCALRGTV